MFAKKKMNGSGFADFLLEAGLITSGSVEGVLSGKNYDRALNCHTVMVECLERLLFEVYLERHDQVQLSDDSKLLIKSVIENLSHNQLHEALENLEVKDYLERYQNFRDEVKAGLLGPTAQLWVTYMDHVWLLLTLNHAVKHNDFTLYAHCLHLMTDLFFSFGGQNYARYLTYFSVFLSNIETSHPGSSDLLKRGAISVARSFIPGNRCAVDKTMEETFMRHAKSRGGGAGAGVSGVLSNHEAYQRWALSMHQRSLFVESTLGMAGMLSTSSANEHHAVRPSQVLKSEKMVSDAMSAVRSFLSPFSEECRDRLVILSSGATASPSIEADVLRAEKAGAEAKEAFIETRLKQNKGFFEPIKRLNLKTLGDMDKSSKVTTSKNKVLQFKQQGDVAFQLLFKSQTLDLNFDLRELLTNPLTPVPFSIGTADGYLAKTDKSKGFKFLTKEEEDSHIPLPGETLVLQDGNAVFYYIKELPGNFSKICSHVFDMLPKTGDVIFSPDSYDPLSIKALERKRRGCGKKLIIKGENTKKPQDWKQFLSNDENKQQFIRLLSRLWRQDSYAPKLKDREVIVICDGKATRLTSADGITTTATDIESLMSTQEETDSRFVLYGQYGNDRGYPYLRFKSPDTDVFYILLHHASRLSDTTILFDTGVGNKKRVLNISSLAEGYTQEYCAALLGLHCFTGIDTASAFKGLGKVKPMKKLQSMPRFVPVLARLGDSWDVPEHLMDDLEAFTCVLYGNPRTTSVNELRYMKMSHLCDTTTDATLQASKTIDFANLPPCRRSLEQHIKRANYQAAIWKRAHIAKPDIPSPSNGHGWTIQDGILEPLWFEGDVLPRRLADLVEEVAESDDSSDDGTRADLCSSSDSDSD